MSRRARDDRGRLKIRACQFESAPFQRVRFAVSCQSVAVGFILGGSSAISRSIRCLTAGCSGRGSNAAESPARSVNCRPFQRMRNVPSATVAISPASGAAGPRRRHRPGGCRAGLNDKHAGRGSLETQAGGGNVNDQIVFGIVNFHGASARLRWSAAGRVGDARWRRHVRAMSRGRPRIAVAPASRRRG